MPHRLSLRASSRKRIEFRRGSAFFCRATVPGRRLRIEERSIKPEDALFVAGTLTENPGVQVRPYAPRDARADSSHMNDAGSSAPIAFSERRSSPQIVKLFGGAAPSGSQQMSQQSKIAAALTRAGITRPEAWTAAGVPYQSVALEENAAPTPVSAREEEQSKSSDFNLAPPVVLMKGANDPAFVISFRSQKEFAVALAWKSAAMVWGGAAITLLGLYMLLTQMELL